MKSSTIMYGSHNTVNCYDYFVHFFIGFTVFFLIFLIDYLNYPLIHC